MGQLEDHPRAFGVNRVGDLAPRLDLVGTGDAGLAQIALAESAVDPGRLGHDQPPAAARKGPVIVGHFTGGAAIGGGADPGQGGDHGAVGQRQACKRDRPEQVSHGRNGRREGGCGSHGHTFRVAAGVGAGGDPCGRRGNQLRRGSAAPVSYQSNTASLVFTITALVVK